MDLNELRRMAHDDIEITGWDGKPMTVTVRKASITVLAVSGRIPNPLVPVVRDLLSGVPKTIEKVNAEDAEKALLGLANALLVSPSKEELEAADAMLTDTQLSEIYAYALGGAEALRRFRDGVRRGIGQSVRAVQETAQRDDEDL